MNEKEYKRKERIVVNIIFITLILVFILIPIKFMFTKIFIGIIVFANLKNEIKNRRTEGGK